MAKSKNGGGCCVSCASAKSTTDLLLLEQVMARLVQIAPTTRIGHPLDSQRSRGEFVARSKSGGGCCFSCASAIHVGIIKKSTREANNMLVSLMVWIQQNQKSGSRLRMSPVASWLMTSNTEMSAQSPFCDGTRVCE